MSLTWPTDLPSVGKPGIISFPVTMITVISPDISPSAASNGIDNNKGNEHYNKNNGHLLPIFLRHFQNTGFAWATAIAKLILIVAPKPTVSIRRRRRINSPHSCTDKREIARRRRLATSRLNRRQILVIELLCSLVYAVTGEVLANLGILKAALDLLPVARFVNLLLQPVRIVPQPVFFESPIRQHLPGALVGHNEGKDRDGEDEDYEQKHENKIDPQKECYPTAYADESRYGQQHEERAYSYNRPLQELLADWISLCCQPYPASQDDNREKERNDIDSPNNVIAETTHLCNTQWRV